MAAREAGNKRINFLATRYEKDVRNFMTFIMQLNTGKFNKETPTSISKQEFKKLWEYLKVCSAEVFNAPVMSMGES